MANAAVDLESSVIQDEDFELVVKETRKAAFWSKLLPELGLTPMEVLQYWKKTRKDATWGAMSQALEKTDKKVWLMFKGEKLQIPGNDSQDRSALDKKTKPSSTVKSVDSQPKTSVPETINRTVIVKLDKKKEQEHRKSKDQTSHEKYHGRYDVSDPTAKKVDLKVYGFLSKEDKNLFTEGNTVVLENVIVHTGHLVFATRPSIKVYPGEIDDVTPDDRAMYGAVSLSEIKELQDTMEE